MLNQVLFTVDYNIEGTKGRFMSDLSFTFLHWNLIEQLNERKLEVSCID